MERKFCIYPLTTLNITAPVLTPCCFSMMRQEDRQYLTAMTGMPFEMVWNSAVWKWWRERIASDDYSGCSMCTQTDSMVTEEELRAKYPDIADEVMKFKNGDHSQLKHPSTMVLSFDYTCNLRCTTCRPSDRPLHRWDIPHLIDLVMEYMSHVKRIVIAGDGEVAVSPLYRKILSSVGPDTKITLMSNGTLLDMDFWGSVGENVLRQIDRVHISCDGTTKEVYESIRLNGLFDKWMENMAVLMSLAEQYGWTTKMMYTVSKGNYADFRNVGQFARRIGFDELFVGIAAPWSRAAEGGDWTTVQSLDEPEKSIAENIAKKMIEEYPE
jgi:sulfatase maturation enzyme AslB (radical SAM superfamily)